MDYKNSKEEHYVAAMVLHALGDTIGFKNGEWEFNYFNTYDITSINMTADFLYDFIDLGGINGINLENWIVSDDTILNIATARSIVSSHGIYNDKMINATKKEFIEAYEQMIKDGDDNLERYPGKTTMKYIEMFNKGTDGIKEPYDRNGGGNGAAMRTMPFGLIFYKDKDTLIESAINMSKLTHNCAVGYLGGLVVALFTAYALDNIPVAEWGHKMLAELETQSVRKYITKNPDDYEDYETFLKYWYKYINGKFENGKIVKSRANKNIVFRSNYYLKHFTPNEVFSSIGMSGYSATIVAYDALIDCDGKWEKLVIYSGLHLGDSDTTCCIAAGLYGAVYGFGDVPDSNLEHLEFKKDLIMLGKALCKLVN